MVLPVTCGNLQLCAGIGNAFLPASQEKVGRKYKTPNNPLLS
jgi:hypothetical protein